MSYFNQTIGEALRARMSAISEACWCAEWMSDLEFDLWRIVTGGDRSYGQGVLTAQEVNDLLSMSVVLGGWHDGDDFVPMREWIPRFNAHEAKRAEDRRARDAELMSRPYFNREALVARSEARAALKEKAAAAEAAFEANKAATPRWTYQVCLVCGFACNGRTLDEARRAAADHKAAEHPWTQDLPHSPDVLLLRFEERDDARMLELLDELEGGAPRTDVERP